MTRANFKVLRLGIEPRDNPGYPLTEIRILSGENIIKKYRTKRNGFSITFHLPNDILGTIEVAIFMTDGIGEICLQSILFESPLI